MDQQAEKRSDRKCHRTRQDKRGDSKVESNDSPEIPDEGETSDIPGLPSGVRGDPLGKVSSQTNRSKGRSPGEVISQTNRHKGRSPGKIELTDRVKGRSPWKSERTNRGMGRSPGEVS